MAAAPEQSLEYGAILGQGGMGVVYEAEDRTLGRTLAVKALRSDRQGPAELRALLAEARITSVVSHPNVVPIHDVRIGPDGRPHILLKRIDGRPWSRLLRDPMAVERGFDQPDALLFHVRVLSQVCAAVHAAHARQIVHRDLKPGNIMVGPDGAVYVLDWGLAASLDPDADPRLPRLSATAPGAGTPQYMAPEMVSDRYGEVGPWTDVYLLGGLLFQVLWGRPPHDGANAMNMVIEACRNGVRVPDDGPAELVDLCRRCLARVPGERVQDAETVRRALRTWIDHRASVALTREAQVQQAKLMKLARAPTEGLTDSRMHDVFGAAVFVYHRALEAWPENPDARYGLEQTVRAMVRHALDRDAWTVASAALGYLRTPPAALLSELHEAQERGRRRERQRQRLAMLGLGDVNDPRLSSTARIWLRGSGFAMVFISGTTALVAPWLGGLSPDLLLTSAVLGVLAVLVAVGRALARPLLGLELRIAGHLVFFAVARVLVLAAAVSWGVDADTAMALELGVTMVLLAHQALAFDRRLRIVAALAGLSAVLTLAIPGAGAALLVVTYASMSVQLMLSDLGSRSSLEDPQPVSGTPLP